MQSRIYVRMELATWVADFRDAHDCKEIENLMGTCVIPTPFNYRNSIDKVISTLKARNPGCEVLPDPRPIISSDLVNDPKLKDILEGKYSCGD